MKRIQKPLALVLALLCLMPSVLAATVLEDTYSNAPANPTQENVHHIEACYLPEEGENAPCMIQTLEPSQLTIDTLKDIFGFVDINRLPPVQWFPEETQKEIAEIIQGDPDALYMPEFMAILPQVQRMQAPVQVDMHMNIDYLPGQLVVPVLGRETDAGLVWKALPGQVTAGADGLDVIRFVVPEDAAALFAGQETQFALLAAKPAVGGLETDGNIREEEVFIPSKNASDIIYVVEESVRNQEGVPLDCQILIVQKTNAIEAELQKMTESFTNPGQPPIRYFDADTVQETARILKGVDIDTLLPYEITQVMAKDYQEPYGDVMAKFAFPTPFAEDKGIIAIIGMPDPREPGLFHWMPLHAEIADHYIEITFSSSVLPAMMQEAGLLLVMSEAIE